MSDTTDTIMTKLYGATATQMMGGKAIATSKTSKSKKVEKSKKTNKNSVKSNEKIEMCPYPEYITNENFKLFMSKFYMIKRVCHSYSATIYVIPPKKQLVKMIEEFEKILKKEGIEPNTIEAYRYVVTNDLPYKRCIFNMFADSTADNYRLDEVKMYRNFGLVKRTNGLREQYFFQYNSEYEITIYPTQECVEKDGKKAKLIACCDNGIYVFEGELPAPNNIYQKQVISKGMTGGAENIAKIKEDMLVKALKKGEVGAYKYVCSFAAAEHLKNKNYNKISKNFSGDLLHSAFSIAFDNNIDFVPTTNFSQSDLSKSFDNLLKEFKLNNGNINAQEVQQSIKASYLTACKKNNSPIDVTKAFIQSVSKKYTKLGMATLKADFACNLYSMGYRNDLHAILSMCNSIDNPKQTALASASVVELEGEKELYGSKFAKLLCRGLCAAPLLGVVAKSYYPIKFNYKNITSRMIGGNDEIEYEEDENDVYDDELEGDDDTENVEDYI